MSTYVEDIVLWLLFHGEYVLHMIVRSAIRYLLSSSSWPRGENVVSTVCLARLCWLQAV